MAHLTQTSWQSGSRPTSPIVNVNYFPSDGISSTDIDNISRKMQSNLSGLSSDYSFSIMGKPSSGLDKTSTMSQGTMNAQVGESIYTSFSNGHHAMFETAANQVRKQIAQTGSYDTPTVLVSFEGMTSNAYGNAEACKENMKYLAEQGIPYVFASSQGKSAAIEGGFANPYAESGYYVGEYLRAGGTVYVLDLEGAAHADNEKGFMQQELDNNFIGALAGNGTLNENTDKYKGIYKYEVDPNTGKLIKTELNKDEFLKSIRDDSYSAAGVTTEGVIEKMYNQSNSLGEFANNFGGVSTFKKTLASDLTHVYNSMDSLQSKISPTQTGKVGSGGIVGSMDSALSYYGNITNGMLGTLGNEIGAVKSIAEAIYNMDGAVSAIAQDSLSDGLNSFMSNVSYSQSDIDTINSFSNTLGNEISNFINNVNMDSFNPFNDLQSIGTTSISDLNSALNNAIDTFQSEKQNANEMRSIINDFASSIGDNNILSGELWDAVKGNMEVYSGLMDLRENASQFLLETMIIANEMVREAIEPDSSMDASKLPELETSLQEVNQQITNLTEQVNQMRASQHEVCSYDENNEPYDCHEEPSDADIAAVENTLHDYEAQRDELEYQIERINNYIEAVNKAQQLINDAINQVNSTYGKAAESLKNNGTLPNDISLDFSAYQSGEYRQYLDNFSNRLLGNGPTPAVSTSNNMPSFLYDLGKYSTDPSKGFDLWLSQNRYGMVDFANSQLRGRYGYNEQQALEAFIGVIIAESDKTNDDALAVASVALNRCQNPNWSNYYQNGTNPFDQMFAKGGSQYETITNTSHYYGNLHSYEAYMPSVVGMDNVNKVLAQYGTNYESLKSTVMDALGGGVRNNFYTGFRANGYEGWSDIHISPDGNKYQFEGYGGRDQAFAASLKNQLTATSLSATSGGSVQLLVQNGATVNPGDYGFNTPQVTTLEYVQPTTNNNAGPTLTQLSSSSAGSSNYGSSNYGSSNYRNYGSYESPSASSSVYGGVKLVNLGHKTEYNPITFEKPNIEISTNPFIEPIEPKNIVEISTENIIIQPEQFSYSQPSNNYGKIIGDNNSNIVVDNNIYRDESLNYFEPKISSKVIDSNSHIIDTNNIKIDGPIIEDYSEKAFVRIPENVPENVVLEPKPQQKHSYISMGAASGVGIAMGAAAIGTYALLKDKTKKEEVEDNGYKK